MKFFCLTAFLSLAVAVTGCGTTRGMVKGSASNHVQTIQTQDFLAWGHVSQTSRGIELTVGSDDLFYKKSSRLTKAGSAKLAAIAAAILKYPESKVLVIGYTDNRGTDVKNVQFSENRATRVMVELVKQGLLSAKVNAVGNGSIEPIAPNNSEANKAKNRRIVFEINY